MKGIVFDLDQTIIESSALKELRDRRDWQAVKNNISKITIFPGMKELVEKAKGKNYAIAIVTNLPSSICKLSLEQVGISVDAQICWHDTVKHKPEPEPILKALAQLNADPRVSFGIGDTSKDIDAYNKSGITSVFVTWGEDPIPQNADFVVNSPIEIGALI